MTDLSLPNVLSASLEEIWDLEEGTTDSRLWRRWDTDADSWGTPLTGGELLVARGLGDIRGRIAR